MVRTMYFTVFALCYIAVLSAHCPPKIIICALNESKLISNMFINEYVCFISHFCQAGICRVMLQK